MSRRLPFALLILWSSAPAEDEVGKIMRPADKSIIRNGAVDIVATAPGGSLELDGKPVAAEKPFPDVLHAKVKVAEGIHTLTLIWEGGRKQVTFAAGSSTPTGFSEFRQHPPLQDIACTQCHELSKRGRFRFKGGCFDCHKTEGFTKVHTHTAEVLTECGLCHNAHGSIAKAHLVHTKEIACKQCHN